MVIEQSQNDEGQIGEGGTGNIQSGEVSERISEGGGLSKPVWAIIISAAAFAILLTITVIVVSFISYNNARRRANNVDTYSQIINSRNYSPLTESFSADDSALAVDPVTGELIFISPTP